MLISSVQTAEWSVKGPPRGPNFDTATCRICRLGLFSASTTLKGLSIFSKLTPMVFQSTWSICLVVLPLALQL